jgi:N-alpha-acetyltransferase 15/16, NatA auxiliary subunit
VCWHVYGLLHRSDRNYSEAIRAYKMALKIEPNNVQILKDLSSLQIQMRDLDGFAASRNALLVLKPNLKINWMAFAVARHLAGEHRDAVKVIDIYLGTLTEQSDELGRGFESGELALYRNQIVAEIPDNYREALEHLAVCEGVVVDRTSWLVTKAEYQLALRDYVGAQRTVDLAFDRGVTENFRVHTLYMAVVLELDDYSVVKEAMRLRGTQTLATLIPLSEEQRSRIRHAYAQDLLPRYPNSYAVQSIPITLLSLSAATASSSSSSTIPDETASALQQALEDRCRKGLVKGVPSLCSELASFVWVERDGRYVRPDDPVDYASHPVFRTMAAMVDGFVSCLEAESKFAPSDDLEQPPTTILWAWFLRAGLHELSGEYDKGLELVAKCLDHTPSEVDVYELKGRLLALSGDPEQAADCVEQGRELDKQDRYMNNLTTQYMLRAGREEQARRTISLFAKHEGNPEQNLFDMQCSWYELEVAEHYARTQEWGRSLKKYGTSFFV